MQNSDFFNSCKNGDLIKVRQIVENIKKLSNAREKLQELFSEKARNEYEALPLHWACANAHFEIAQYLLDNGAEVDCRNRYFATPLSGYASYNGKDAIVRLLIERGADIHAQCNNGDTALHFACDKNHKSTVKLLLSLGASNEIRNKRGERPSDLCRDLELREYVLQYKDKYYLLKKAETIISEQLEKLKTFESDTTIFQQLLSNLNHIIHSTHELLGQRDMLTCIQQKEQVLEQKMKDEEDKISTFETELQNIKKQIQAHLGLSILQPDEDDVSTATNRTACYTVNSTEEQLQENKIILKHLKTKIKQAQTHPTSSRDLEPKFEQEIKADRFEEEELDRNFACRNLLSEQMMSDRLLDLRQNMDSLVKIVEPIELNFRELYHQVTHAGEVTGSENQSSKIDSYHHKFTNLKQLHKQYQSQYRMGIYYRKVLEVIRGADMGMLTSDELKKFKKEVKTAKLENMIQERLLSKRETPSITGKKRRFSEIMEDEEMEENFLTASQDHSSNQSSSIDSTDSKTRNYCTENTTQSSSERGEEEGTFISAKKQKHATDNAKSTLCIACCTNVKNVVFLPCKHMVLCKECKNQLVRPDVCPVCRDKVDSFMDVFL